MASVKQTNFMSSQDVLALPVGSIFTKLKTSVSGLKSKEAKELVNVYGPNEVAKREKRAAVIEFLLRFKNPMIIILLVASIISGILGEWTNTIIIFAMVLMSIILDYFQETKAERAAEELKERIATTTSVIRDGTEKEVNISELVPGDIIILSAGNIVPADARVITAKDFFVDQSALTGESFPVEKVSAQLNLKENSPVTDWINYLFMGTSVASGTATAVVVKTGGSTSYGEIVKTSIERRPETEFEKGLRKFGMLVMQVTLMLVIFVFFVNALLKRDVLESLLFAIALAVGLTPELLPMIVSVNLSKGAVDMSKKDVIVKRLASIQNFGSMDVLCADKTGTLTENKVALILHIDARGKESEKVLQYSFLNSYHQTGIKTPLDEAIMKHKHKGIAGFKKIDEIPFDFVRKRSSIVVQSKKERILITKGAPEEIFKICRRYEVNGKVNLLNSGMAKQIEEEYQKLSTDGFRVLGISYRKVKERKTVYEPGFEKDMVFLGFVAFMDPPKLTARESIKMIEKSGIALKILTGDNEFVTRKVCNELGFKINRIVLGDEIAKIDDEAILKVVEDSNIFCRVNPIQKDRILLALKKNGHVVGFLGDGINDAPSMKAADVSISVSNAVDIAKETADIILLHKDLKVLHEGVLEGRKTFGNTMKYIMMGMSSNFGNMISAAGASLFLKFLPMLPIQIILNNFLYDFSEVTIPTDNVDKEYIEKPKKLDIKLIREFMLFFGPVSSIFDFLTFFVMIAVFNAAEPLFQTAWFIESLCTQTLVIFSIRTRKIPFFVSKPSRLLVLSSLSVVGLGILLPFTILGVFFKFTPPPFMFLLMLIGFVFAYLFLIELMKTWFYKRHNLAS